MDVSVSINNLEVCNYRYLQKIAKSLNLPSNVKKMYLIEMIRAKKFCSQPELEQIIQRVKLERQNASQNKKIKKKKVQGTEISSTRSSLSPSIATTPQQTPTFTVQKSPNLQQNIIRYPRRQFQRTQALETDRVLRSSNLKISRPNYRILEGNDTVLNVIKNHNPVTEYQNVQQKLFKSSVCVKKLDGQLMSVNVSPPRPAKRQRTVSGIYPLKQPTDNTRSYIEYIPKVGFRWSDGKITKINAVVHKPQALQAKTLIPLPSTSKYTKSTSKSDRNSLIKPITVTIQDVINQKIDHQIPRNTEMSNYTQTYSDESRQHLQANATSTSIYYHKKIRSEHNLNNMRKRDEVLPRINEVFSQFNEYQYNDLNQPLYVRVTEGICTTPHPIVNTDNTVMLESLYNIKHRFIVNQPLLQVKTTTDTKLIYSTPIICSAVAHQSTVAPTHYNMYGQGDQYQYNIESETMPRLYDYWKMSEDYTRPKFRCNEEVSPCSSVESVLSPRLGTNVTIPEMVDDALELISQDGDYMERLGIDGRMQCILCEWIGPKLLLENHIRKEHSSAIECVLRGECRVRVPLSVVLRRVHCTVLQHARCLYALACFYRDECLCVQLASLTDIDPTPHGRVVIYNKLSGKPYVWDGEVRQIPDTFPDLTGYNCLKLDIAGLDLLPNNVKLVNRELVVISPNKVILGKSDCSNIDVVLYVRLYD